MTSKTRPFSLTLSTTELGWLAGVFGVTRLALPVPIPVLTEERLRQTQEALAGRGLIRRAPGAGWQVDRLAAFLVHWLGDVERYIRVEVYRRDGTDHQARLYRREELSLLAWCETEQVEFVFFQDGNSLTSELARRLDLVTVRAGEGTFALPEPRELVRVAWQDPSTGLRQAQPNSSGHRLGPARRALTRAGLSKREVESALAWILSLKTFVSFSPVPLGGKEPLLLCSDGAALWAGASGKLSPSSWKDAVRQAREML